MRSVLQLGAWTVRTVLQESKMQETVNELQKYNTHIATLQETIGQVREGWKRQGSGETKFKGRSG